MLDSIQGRLTLLFTAFAVLVIVSVGATYWGLETQRQDALVINLAGRQRTLVQQMTRNVMEWNNSRNEAELTALREAESTFETTLSALRGGGEVPYLPKQVVSLAPARDSELVHELNKLDAHWLDFRSTLDNAALTPSSGALQAVQSESTDLVSHADEVVRAYQAASEARVARLRMIQIGFFVSALFLLAGGWAMRRSLIGPLWRLEEAAARIGRNNLETPVQVEGLSEMRFLTQSFESMRGKLSTSRTELIELTESLERRVAQRTRELNALNEVSCEITSQLDIRRVLNSVTGKVQTLLNGDSAMLCLLGESKQYLHLQAVSGALATSINQERISTIKQAVEVLTSPQALICSDTQCVGGCGLLAGEHAASHLVAPLRIGEQVIGALCVNSAQADRFTKESTDLLTKLANTAAIALQNAQLYAQAERAAALEERHRMAAEMHDGLAQTLSYLNLSIDRTCDVLEAGRDDEALERLRQTRLTIQHAIEDVRRAIEQLLDESPVCLELVEQIENEVREFSSHHGLEVQWQAHVDRSLSCPRPVLEHVIHITREALINAATHAQSGCARVCFERVNGSFQITVQDYGCGFASHSSIDLPRRHFGLKIMQARAEHIGGRVRVESEPGNGTRVTLTWPVVVEEQS